MINPFSTIRFSKPDYAALPTCFFVYESEKFLQTQNPMVLLVGDEKKINECSSLLIQHQVKLDYSILRGDKDHFNQARYLSEDICIVLFFGSPNEVRPNLLDRLQQLGLSKENKKLPGICYTYANVEIDSLTSFIQRMDEYFCLKTDYAKKLIKVLDRLVWSNNIDVNREETSSPKISSIKPG